MRLSDITADLGTVSYMTIDADLRWLADQGRIQRSMKIRRGAT